MKGDMVRVKIDDGQPFDVTEDGEGICKYCQALVLWCVTRRGRVMPVDYPQDRTEPTTSHFSTCTRTV